ncbi:MAG: 16S rRNA (cytosine(1402)-N(4))-methyltransferase RsmH [Nitrospirae bacterium]|nr:16S rRNA (cytosine(1402)-N(4))-methyltransferase RsmH [Nitrospirota bacterium]
MIRLTLRHTPGNSLNMDFSETIHAPVLVKESLEMLSVKGSGIYVDATLGYGGHSAAILERLTTGRLVGIDRDNDAIRHAAERLGNDRVIIRQGRFSQMGDIIHSLNLPKADGILFDLGVSMAQLKGAGRGFSFFSDERLDMRMGKDGELTAWDVVNRYPQKEIERILREYGDEPYAHKISRAIVKQRSAASINTCLELADIIVKVCGRKGRLHPATRTFQALRIEVNNEIEELAEGLSAASRALKCGGVLCVIAYHSTEDRVVKHFIRQGVKGGEFISLTKKPVAPDFEEIRKNPSSRSAKLRGAEKII